VEAINRKLIRPSLNEIKEQITPPRRPPLQKKPAPPDQTNAENFYYVKQMQAKTPMVFVLRDGETLHGHSALQTGNQVHVQGSLDLSGRHRRPCQKPRADR
jgi:hypothetical protein